MISATQSSDKDVAHPASVAIDGKLASPSAGTKTEIKPWLKVKFDSIYFVSQIWTKMGAGYSSSTEAVIQVSLYKNNVLVISCGSISDTGKAVYAMKAYPCQNKAGDSVKIQVTSEAAVNLYDIEVVVKGVISG